MRRNVFRFLLPVLLVSSFRVWAQQAPELSEIVVTATRVPSPALETPNLTTIITAEDLRQEGAVDLSDALARQSGVVVNDYGPQGQSKTVSIRGSTSSQVLILVDGIRVNSSFDGSVDLSRIPVAMIDHIEIVQGGTSSLWGTGAVGGVVNIITRKSDKPLISLEVTNGSYLPHSADAVTESSQERVPATAMSLVDSQNMNLFLSGKVGELGISGGGSFTRAANAFLWNDADGIDGWRQRNNAQDLAQSAFAGVDVPLGEGMFSTKGTFTHSLAGVPGSTTFPSSQASQEDTAVDGFVSYTASRFLLDALSVDAKGSYRYFTETAEDPSVYTSRHRTQAANLDLTQKLFASDSLSLVYGGTAVYEQIDSTNLTGSGRRVSLAGFLSVPFNPVAPLTLTPSLRYDAYSDFPGFLSFQLGAVWALSPDSSLRASVSSAYRVPTLSDLYWTDAYTTRSSGLKAETSYNAEMGWALQRDRLSFQTAAFARLVFNQIEWVYSSQTFVTTVMNITEALLPGIEAHGKLGLTDRVSLWTDYAFIYSLLVKYPYGYTFSYRQRVPWVPEHNLTVGVGYDDAVHHAAVDAQYVSRKFYFDSVALAWNSLDGYLVLNAEYSIKASEALSFSLKVANILNSLYYTEAGGYPMPPFSVETGVQLHY